MSVVADVEELALKLSDSERGRLAEKLLASLPSDFDGDVDGIEDAIRRSREMDENPEMAISMNDLDEMIRKRFPECV